MSMMVGPCFGITLNEFRQAKTMQEAPGSGKSEPITWHIDERALQEGREGEVVYRVSGHNVASQGFLRGGFDPQHHLEAFLRFDPETKAPLPHDLAARMTLVDRLDVAG